MTVTIPVIKSSLSPTLRQIWEGASHELPEPVTWNGTTVVPNDGVTIPQGGIQYVTLPRAIGERWTLMWITLEGPEEKLPKVEFDNTNPKSTMMVQGLRRPPELVEMERKYKEEIAAKIVELQAKETNGV